MSKVTTNCLDHATGDVARRRADLAEAVAQMHELMLIDMVVPLAASTPSVAYIELESRTGQPHSDGTFDVVPVCARDCHGDVVVSLPLEAYTVGLPDFTSGWDWALDEDFEAHISVALVLGRDAQRRQQMADSWMSM